MASRPAGLILWILVLTAPSNARADAIAYRIKGPSATLSQVAIKLYGNERLWKQISYWNGLRPPYKLHPGQILVLRLPPDRAKDDLIAIAEPKRIVIEKPSVERQLEQRGNDFTYTVGERAPSLSMVARDLYGDLRYAPEIAKWNHLPVKAKLRLGQTLHLEKTPLLSENEGTIKLIAAWLALDNPDMIVRLTGPDKLPLRRPSSMSLVEAGYCSPIDRLVPQRQPGAVLMSSPEAPGPDRDPASAPFAKESLELSAPREGFTRVESDLTAPMSSQKVIEPQSDSYWLGNDNPAKKTAP